MAEKSIIPFVVIATILIVILIFFLVMLLIIIKNKQNRKVKELYVALVNESERTMLIISREIHDNIIQMLNFAQMTAHMLDGKVPPADSCYLNQLNEILHKIVLDAHYASRSLNSEFLRKTGLVAILEQSLSWLNATKAIKASLEIKGEQKEMLPEKEIMVIRIAQEAINNVLKYAEASTLSIRLTYKAKSLQLEVVDDGVGFSDKVNNTSGIGIQNMHQRTKIIMGTLELVSSPHMGTAVILSVPLK